MHAEHAQEAGVVLHHLSVYSTIIILDVLSEHSRIESLGGHSSNARLTVNVTPVAKVFEYFKRN